jgi:4-amino-4-deoxy-L-arabinose transferase-like glycosyltransferase
MTLGDSELIVRGFSALWGVLTLPVAYLLGARIGGRAVGLLAALILALAPLHIGFAQDARMYTMLTFNASMALLCAVQLLGDPAMRERKVFGRPDDRRPTTDGETSSIVESGVSRPIRTVNGHASWLAANRWWLRMIVFTTLTMLSHNTAIFFPIAMGLFIAGAFGVPALVRRVRGGQALGPDHRLRNWSVALASALLLWLPWLPSFLVQSRRVDNEFWIPQPTLKSVLETWRDFASAFVPAGSFPWTLALAFAVVALLGLWWLRRQPAVLTLLLLLIVVPFAGELLVSIRRPIFYTRTLIWASIPFYLLLAAGLIQLRLRPLIAVATLGFILVSGRSLENYYRNYEPEGWRDAAGWMAPQVRAGDMVLFNAGWVQIPFDYYYRRVGQPVDQHGLPADLFDRGILEPKMTAADVKRLEQLIADRRRVWLVYSHNWYTDPQSIIPRSLGVRLGQTRQQRFNGLDIFMYERKQR